MSFSKTARGAMAACALVAASLSLAPVQAAQADTMAQTSAEASGSSAKIAWTLDPENSELNFVTVKAGDIAEAHSFGKLSGSISGKKAGQSATASDAEVEVDVHLDSVETNIPIRNERMREFLFETTKYPVASVHGDFPIEKYLQVPVGGSMTNSLELMLELHGQQTPITAEVLALRVGEDRYMVTTTKPIIINASSVGLVAGIDKLQQLASLPSISKAVPVSFVLTFVR